MNVAYSVSACKMKNDDGIKVLDFHNRQMSIQLKCVEIQLKFKAS